MESAIYLSTEKPGNLLLKFAVPCIFPSLFPILLTRFNGAGYLGNAATGVIFLVTVIGWGILLFFGDGAALILISYIWGDGLLRLIGATDANPALAHMDSSFIR